MEITEVRVFPIRDNRLRAYVSITLDDCFVIRDLKIIEGDKGLFVAMPARRRHDGTYRDIAHPLNSETRAAMEKRILEVYKSQEEWNEGAEGWEDEMDEDDGDDPGDKKTKRSGG